MGFWGFLGFWIFGILGILDFGLWGFLILAFGILDFGDFGFGFWGFGILDFRDFGDFGFLEHYVADLYVQSLDFGDFGFWGSWILDFGLGILDGHLVTKFWMLHKKRRLCTPNRVGGLDLKLGSIDASCQQHAPIKCWSLPDFAVNVEEGKPFNFQHSG